MKRKLFKIMAVVMVAVFGVAGVCLAEIKPWAPYRGSSEVCQFYTYQILRFSSLAIRQHAPGSTYEHEVQIYNKAFADYGGYWTSNLPNAYRDTQASDFWPFASNRVDNFAIGTFTASRLSPEKYYFTNMALKKTTTDQKMNDFIKTNSSVRIKGQKGKLYGSTYDPWYVFPESGQTTQDPPLYKNSKAEHPPVCWEYK